MKLGAVNAWSCGVRDRWRAGFGLLGSATVGRVGPEHLEAMSRSLQVPVSIDATGWLRCGIELRFSRRADRTVHPSGARVGMHAQLVDVLALGDVRVRCARYNDALDALRMLRDRLRSNVTPLDLLRVVLDRNTAHAPGARGAGDLAYEDLLRLDEIIAYRQSRCMGYGTVRVETLDLEIGFLRRQHARLAAGLTFVSAALPSYARRWASSLAIEQGSAA